MNVAKLLLVEDDNNLREIYEARLSAEGYDISTAQNGEEALSIAKQLRPDLIISDVMMPRISGFEMLDILRNTDELKSTKIIMLTAPGQAEDRSRADSLGADKYLVKSQVTLEDIVQAAHELLEGTEVEPVAVPSPVATTPIPESVAEPVATPEVVAAPTDVVVPTPVEVAPELVAGVPVAPIQVVQVVEPPMAPDPTQPAVQPSLVTPAPEPVAIPVTPVLDTATATDVSSDDTTATAIPTVENDNLVLPQVTPSVVPSPDPIPTPPIATVPPMPTPEQPVTPEEAANDSVLEAAINNLTTEPVSEVPAPIPVPVVATSTADPINPSEPTGRKVISPITDPAQGPDINALLAQEEAQETNQAATPAAPPTTIIPNTPVQASAPTPINGVDPSSIAL